MRIATKEEWERAGYAVDPDADFFLLKDVEHISERWVTKHPNPKARDVDNTDSSEHRSSQGALIAFIELTDNLHDEFYGSFENGVKWLNEQEYHNFEARYPAITAAVHKLLAHRRSLDENSP